MSYQPPQWGPPPQQPWGPPPAYGAPPPPPKSTNPLLIVLGAFVVMCMVIPCLTGMVRGFLRGSESPRSEAPRAVPAPPSSAPIEPATQAVQPVSAAELDAVAAGVHQRLHDIGCYAVSRRRERCQVWYPMAQDIRLIPRGGGLYRAEVRTVLQRGDDMAITICARVMLALPGTAVDNMSSSVRVLDFNGHIIAHNNFGRCTAGIF